MTSYLGPEALVRLLWAGLRLHAPTYREVSRAAESTRLCLAVTVLGGAASGLVRGASLGLVPALAVVVHILIALVVLCCESLMIWMAARLWLRPEASPGEVLRPLAIANAPRLADLVLLGGHWAAILVPLGRVWQLAAFVVGVEAAVSRGWLAATALTLGLGVFRWVVFALIMRA